MAAKFVAGGAAEVVCAAGKKASDAVVIPGANAVAEMVEAGFNEAKEKSRSISVTINNKSTRAALTEPLWYTHHGHHTGEAPRSAVAKDETCNVKFHKIRFSIFGCSGLITYRIEKTTKRIAIVCRAPIFEGNSLALAILDDNDENDKKKAGPNAVDMYTYLWPSIRNPVKLYKKKKG